MARPRKSLEAHIRDGTYRRDRHGPLPQELAAQARAEAGQARPAARIEKPPDVEQGDLWEELTRLLGGVVTERDVPMLRELVLWWGELRRVQAKIRETDPCLPNYTRLIGAAAKIAERMDKIGARFGLTPADRAKLRAVDPGPPAGAKVPTRPRTKLDASGPPKG